MTNNDELALKLKKLAQSAGADEWQSKKISGDQYVIRKGSYQAVSGYRTYQPIAEIDHKPTRDYVAYASPAAILALLAERDADKKVIADSVVLFETLRQRIAELEARTVSVKLPNPHAHLIWIQAGRGPDDYWDDVAVSHGKEDRCCDGSERYPVYSIFEIQEACAAAGINLEVGE